MKTKFSRVKIVYAILLILAVGFTARTFLLAKDAKYDVSNVKYYGDKNNGLQKDGDNSASEKTQNNSDSALDYDSPGYKITGFRSAKFGYTQKQVIESIQKDFNISQDKIVTQKNAREKTELLSISLDSLNPMPAPATVTYIFGYKTKRLIQVIVIWRTKNSSDNALTEFIRASFNLVQYYKSFDLRRFNLQEARAGKNSFLLFAMVNKVAPTSVLEMTLLNVKFSKGKKGEIRISPLNKNKVPVLLKLSYIKDIKNLDIYKIEKGDF